MQRAIRTCIRPAALYGSEASQPNSKVLANYRRAIADALASNGSNKMGDMNHNTLDHHNIFTNLFV